MTRTLIRTLAIGALLMDVGKLKVDADVLRVRLSRLRRRLREQGLMTEWL